MVLQSVDDIASWIGKKCVVAVPTDTVYGLVSSCERALRAFKPRTKPYTILCTGLDQLAIEVKKWEQNVVKPLWPGAVTVVFACGVGVRVPAYEPLLKLLKKVGPLYSTSCNRTEESVCQNVTQIEEIFGPELPIMEGEVGTGIPSKVIRSNGEILRPSPHTYIYRNELKTKL